MVFLAHPLLRPLDGDIMITGEGLDPVLVVGRTLAQDLFAQDGNANDVLEKVHDLSGPRQRTEVAVNDNAVEAVVNKQEHVAEQLGEKFHGQPPHQAWTGQAHGGRQELPPRR
jgi:hypothetical protein